MFISTKNFGPTTPGPPYKARFLDENENLIFCNVPRPAHISSYFRKCNKIDSHNHARQKILALEEQWVTKSPWFWLVTTFIGLTVTDMWKASKYALGLKHFLSNTTIRQFAKIVAMEFIINELSKNPHTSMINQMPLTVNAWR